jgi:ABC-2 type transport system ATP-binding protein
MLRLKEQGVTIFLNSHLLGEVEQVCDRVAILRQGELARVGPVAELTRSQGTWVVGLAPGQTFPLDEASQHGYRVRQAGDRWEVELEAGQTVDSLIDLLLARRLNLRHLVEKRQTLEDLFLKAVGPREGRP